MTNGEDDKTRLLEFLTLQNGRLNFHGDKLWEEMKHFSMVLYVLLGAPFFLIKDLNGLWLIIFPLLAIFVAFIALFIIRKESKDFLDAFGTVLSIENRLGFHKECDTEIPAKIVSDDRMNKLLINESIEKFIERESCKPLTKSTRGWFEIYFIGLIILGFIESFIIFLMFCNCSYSGLSI